MDKKKRLQSVNAKSDAIIKLSGDIREFYWHYGIYGFDDYFERRTSNILDVISDIQSGNTGYIKSFLQEIIQDEDAYLEHKSTATEILHRLAKIEKKLQTKITRPTT